MKIIKLTVMSLLLWAALPLCFAHAEGDPYGAFYTVAAPGSTVQDTTFTLSQQPWLYIEFYATPPVSGPSVTNDFTVTTPNSTVYHPYDHTDANQIWIWYPTSVWNSVKTVGNWTINGSSFNDNALIRNLQGGVANFKITAAPEPLGTVLFLTGALIMGISLVRRKKEFQPELQPISH